MTNSGIIFPRAPDSARHFVRYLDFIRSRSERELGVEERVHNHHIVPKCLGGLEGDNLISLTPRQHYLAHALLALAFSSVWGLGRAINCFRESARNSRVFERVARHGHSEETKRQIGLSNQGKPRPRKIPMSAEERSRRAETARNRVWSKESREKLRDSARRKPTIAFALAAANSPDRDRSGGKNSRANPDVWNN